MNVLMWIHWVVVVILALTTPTDTQSLLQPSKLKLLTWNMKLLPYWAQELFEVVISSPEDYRRERAALIEGKFEEFRSVYDVILLQEAFWTASQTVGRVLDAAERAGYELIRGPDATFPDVSSGLVILSQLPILSSSSRVYTGNVGYAELVTKSILHAAIQLPDRTLHIFNTHMQASTTDFAPPWHPARKARWGHLNQARDFVRETVSRNNVGGKDLVILGGDFNADGMPNGVGPGEYEDMMNLFRNTSNELVGRDIVLEEMGFPRITYSPWDDPLDNEPKSSQKEKRLDYFISFRHEGYTVADANVLDFKVNGQSFSQLSDHSGVEVELELD